jgi:hypothetical protein
MVNFQYIDELQIGTALAFTGTDMFGQASFGLIFKAVYFSFHMGTLYRRLDDIQNKEKNSQFQLITVFGTCPI